MLENDSSSGATSTTRLEREKLNVVVYKHHNTITRPSKKTATNKNVNVDDFVALSADYKDPITHPPGHN